MSWGPNPTLSSWTKSVCSLCRLNYVHILISLSVLDDGAAIQDALEEMTHQRSVPNIFIAKKHIGGNSDLQAKKSQLPELLKDAGAL